MLGLAKRLKCTHLPGVDERGLWRPGGASADRGLLGQRQPDRPALLLRRGQALRRDAVLRLPPPARARDQGRAHLQHLRPAHAPATTGGSCRNFIVQALRGEDITLYGDGQQTRSFCYVDDLIEGFLRLMDTRRRTSPGRSTSAIRASSPSVELAEKVIAADRLAAPGSCTGRCRRTIRSSASPTSRARGRCWAGRLGTGLDEGLRRRSTTSGRGLEKPVSRWVPCSWRRGAQPLHEASGSMTGPEPRASRLMARRRPRGPALRFVSVLADVPDRAVSMCFPTRSLVSPRRGLHLEPAGRSRQDRLDPRRRPSPLPSGDSVQSALNVAAARRWTGADRGPLRRILVLRPIPCFPPRRRPPSWPSRRGSLAVFSAFAFVGPLSDYRLPVLLAGTVADRCSRRPFPGSPCFVMPDIFAALDHPSTPRSFLGRFDELTTAQKVVLTAPRSFAVAAPLWQSPLWPSGCSLPAILWRLLNRNWSTAALVAALVPVLLTPVSNLTVSWATLDRPSAGTSPAPDPARPFARGQDRRCGISRTPARKRTWPYACSSKKGSPDNIWDFL